MSVSYTHLVPYHIVNTEIAKILFEERNEKPTCSLCAKMRKGALNQAIKELGCNKVAYAHHMDDVIETAFLSMIFEGRDVYKRQMSAIPKMISKEMRAQ